MPIVPFHPGDRLFTAEQLVRRPVNEVFAFFSDPSNLEAITPAWLSFRIIGQTTDEIRSGTEFTYRLKLYGIPLTWRSLITDWEPQRLFVDLQLQGPYAKWHHTHTFTSMNEGTLVRDRVIYRLPLGRFGQWVGGKIVESDVKRIFRHRQRRVKQLLEQPENAADRPRLKLVQAGARRR
jgi:ligand-binding SRPBCC domain-containing protein